jgi:ABC-type glycerol-3-phosphate transport system substrate-binding protein
VQDNPYETSHDTAFSFFTTGKSALYLNGTWAIGQMAEGPEGEAFFDKVAVIPFPYTKLPNCMANGVDYGWSADSDATGAKADAAVAVLKELCSLETAQDTIYSARVLIGMDVGNVDRDRIGILADLLDVLPQMPAESVDLNIWPALSDPTIYQEFTATIFDYIEGKMTLDEAISKLDSITLGKIK